MNDDQRQEIIRRLKQGEELSPEWARILFPPEKREYELLYHGKEREEEIIANTLAVPLQKARTFGKNGNDWHNKLIFGDNLQVMKSLLELKRSGKLCNADGTHGVRLVYIDPPFATKSDFSGSDDERAYGDKITGSKFLEFLRRRLILIRELLADDGAVYVHLDQKKVHYIKVLMDEIFGEGRLRNELIWHYKFRMMDSDRKFNKKHDTILFYAKTEAHKLTMPKEAWTREEIIATRKQEIHTDKNGREWIWMPGAKGNSKNKQKYLDEIISEGKALDDVWDLPIISSSAKERTGYPTQKPEQLLERIVFASTQPGDIVMDAFAGAGTTCAVAEKMGRRWIAIDCGKLAIYTVQKRMLNLLKGIGNTGEPLPPKPFDLYNAGLYDFSKLKELSWDSWRFFALQLFQCRDDSHKIGGIQLDGYLKGSSVLVFNHQKQPGVRIDEETIRSMHEALGSKVGSRMFIIAPALVFDFQQDYLVLEGVRYYALRIPYSIIHELHQREFSALRQPEDEMAVNDTVEAVGFDFIRSPELEYVAGANNRKGELLSEGVIQIKTFKSEAVVREPTRRMNRETLSMVMLDYDFDAESDVFELDAVFYAEAIQKTDWEVRFPVEAIGKQVMAVFVDIYGNEAREVIPASKFRTEERKAASKNAKTLIKKVKN
ncbi:site-specific DNA-methyltransferase [Corallococcus interemptor]|uniref:site-specific DNA-methyltransferase n=1 Tax=Corallococcus interemptor TaxID=2316720 RepID=UPI003CFC53D2